MLHLLGRKLSHGFLVAFELDQTREQQDHVAPFVHDRGPTISAGDFAGQLVLGGLLGAVIPDEVVVSIGEVDVVFVENGCPLERRS